MMMHIDDDDGVFFLLRFNHLWVLKPMILHNTSNDGLKEAEGLDRYIQNEMHHLNMQDPYMKIHSSYSSGERPVVPRW